MMRKITLTLFLSLAIWQIADCQPINRSSVMIANPQDQTTRDNYAITNIAWGFLPLNDVYAQIDWHDSEVAGILAEGREYHARVEFDAGWRPFIDYCAQNGITYTDHSCRAVDGSLFQYPWFEGNTHNGGSPYWMSSHSATFKNFMKWQIDLALQSGASILMIDAQTSSALAAKDQWSPGDFSTHCLNAFNDYLETTYSSGELSAMGISNVNTFNYRTALNNLGINNTTAYKSAVIAHNSGTELFLYDEYRIFQNYALNELMKDLIAYAQTVTPGVMAGVSSPLIDPYRASILDEIDFYQQELPQIMTNWTYEPVLTYKIAESLNKPMVLTAEPTDWEEALYGHVDDEEIKNWIATGYANGANFIAPAKQWAYGSNSYTPTVDMTYIFQFIQNNQSLFDNRSAIEGKVALIHARESVRQYRYDINDVFYALEDNNIPFDLLIAGDEYYENTPTLTELNKYEKVIVHENIYNWYIANNSALLASLQQLGNKLVLFGENDQASDLVAIKNNLSSTIGLTINGASVDNKMTVYPRVDDSSGSQIIHLINNDYNSTSNAHNTKSNVVVNLDGSVFPNSFSEAILHRPGQSAQTLSLSTSGNNITVNGLGDIDFWGIIELVEGTNSTINVTGVSVSPPTSTLNVGGNVQLAETVLPSNATDKTVTWSSSNNAVATVSNTGLVQAISAGTAIITVKTTDGNFTATSTITISAAGSSLMIEAEDFSATGGTALNDDNSTGFVVFTSSGITGINWNQAGDWGDYTAEIDEAGEYQIQLVTGSPNGNIAAEVSIDGSVIQDQELPNTGGWNDFVTTTMNTNLTLTSGTHTIRILSSGSNAWQFNMDYIRLTKVADLPSVNVDGVTLDLNSLSLENGNTGTLTETVSPANATDKTVTWSTSDASVATVSNSGMVSAVGVGSANISVTTNDGSFTDTTTITVTESGTGAETIIIELEDFTSTGGTSLNADNSTGFMTYSNGGMTGINWNQAGDWGDYDINVTQSGYYEATLSFATPNDNIGVDVSVDGISVLDDALVNTGDWGVFQDTTLSIDLALTAGSHTIRVMGSGSNTWQWNGDHVTLTKVGDLPTGSSSLTIEAESFNATGGTELNGDNSQGFLTYTTGSITAINWNQTGDWVEYNITIDQAGDYSIEYMMATPIEGAAVEFVLNDVSQFTDAVTASGDWETYISVQAAGTVYLATGSHTIRLQSAGSNGWEWNMDKFILSTGGNSSARMLDGQLDTQVEEVSFNMYPNPTSDLLKIAGLENQAYSITIYNLSGAMEINQIIDSSRSISIDVSNLKVGQYFIQIIGGKTHISHRFIKN